MSAIATIQSMQSQASRSPTASFAQHQGAFNAQRQTSVANAPTRDSVVISAAARARLSALDQLQTSSRVIAGDDGGGFSVRA